MDTDFIGMDMGAGDSSAVFVWDRLDGGKSYLTRHADGRVSQHDDLTQAAAMGAAANNYLPDFWHNPEDYDEPLLYPPPMRFTHPHPGSHRIHEKTSILHDDCVECYPNSLCIRCCKLQPCNGGCR